MNDKETKKLQHQYDVWFRGVNRGKAMPNSQNYDQNLKIVATFDTIQSFWSVYTHLVRPNELTGHSDLHVFKSGIKPLWEDEANKDGGMWKLRLRKGIYIFNHHEIFTLSLGEQFMVDDEICGIVVACRYYEDYICVWNRSGNDQEIKARIRDTLKRVLNLPTNIILEYKLHSDALKKITKNPSKMNNKSSSMITSSGP
ncbi:eukaryotic translation initiation factor 4E type 2 [Dermatophagoides farinae]|uniref:eukaryotic translation initiation factor 4E type 2 n=1 Tax=Dermatophagoides farinae TaxID=6954 RepID=UPI003F5DD438